MLVELNKTFLDFFDDVEPKNWRYMKFNFVEKI